MNYYLKVLASSFIALMMLALQSCSDTYDLDNTDNTVAIGGEDFVFPLGETDELTLTKLVDTTGFHNLKTDESGNYYLYFEQEVSEETSFSDFSSTLSISGLTKEISSPEYPIVPSGVARPAASEMVSINFPLNDGFIFKVSFEEARTEQGLVRIDSLTLANAGLKMEARVITDGTLPDPTILTINMPIPERYRIEGGVFAGETLIFQGELGSDGSISFEDLSIKSVSYTDMTTPPFEVEDVFEVTKLEILFPSDQISGLIGHNISFSLVTGIESTTPGDDNVYPERFYGLVDKSLDEIRQLMEIKDVPDFMKGEDVSMDFYNPYIAATLTSNIGVPIHTDLSVLPIIGSSPVYDDQVDVCLETTPTLDPEIPVVDKFWISNEQIGVEAGFTWVEADIPSLIRTIPDSLRIEVTPRSDIDVNQHVVDFTADYKLDAVLKMVVPFSLGESFLMEFSDTLRDLPEIIGKTLEKSDVGLEGQITNMFPMAFELYVTLLDENLNPLDVESSVQNVDAWSGTGSPAVTDLDIIIEKSASAKDAKNLLLNFVAISGSTPGVPIKDDSYLKAVLKLAVHGGIVMDLGE